MSDAATVLEEFDQAYSLALSKLPMPGYWADRARCRTVPKSIFFPGRGDTVSIDDARKVCSRCPVKAECLEYALDAPQMLKGVWAGTTEHERRQLRLERAEVTPARSWPAGSQSATGTLDRLLEQLTKHPGRWARVATFKSRYSGQAVASLLRTGRRPAPAGEWFFEGRRSDDGSELYAMYVGPGQP